MTIDNETIVKTNGESLPVLELHNKIEEGLNANNCTNYFDFRLKKMVS